MSPDIPPLQAAREDGDPPAEPLVQWLQRTAEGCTASFAALHKATHQRLRAEALRVLRQPECADEALQEAWVSIWRGAARYDPQFARPMTWLLCIVRHRAIDRLRHTELDRAHEVVLDPSVSDVCADSAPTPEARVSDSHRQARLAHGLQALDHRHRQAVAMVLMRGCSPPEVAASLGVTAATARTWLAQGLATLQRFTAAAPGRTA